MLPTVLRNIASLTRLGRLLPGHAPAGRLSAAQLVAAHRLSDTPPLYLIGSFDKRVTVLAQQTRALNLAWAMVETGTIPTAGTRPFRVAVVGAGFAGLTFAAALLQKGVAASIDIFEQQDSLLPLQQGSDTRWLHPRIYDWPEEGSEAAAAMLPLLNWTAASYRFTDD